MALTVDQIQQKKALMDWKYQDNKNIQTETEKKEW